MVATLLRKQAHSVSHADTLRNSIENHSWLLILLTEQVSTEASPYGGVLLFTNRISHGRSRPWTKSLDCWESPKPVLVTRLQAKLTSHEARPIEVTRVTEYPERTPAPTGLTSIRCAKSQ